MVRSLISKVKRIRATLTIIGVNVMVFGLLYYRIGTLTDPQWTQGLLFNGADFAPLALDKEWYRIFTHLFMHGNLMHLAFNMYALFVVGSEVERSVGTRKFILIYFACGFIASLVSMYFNLFTIGVGASGAIFGLFGFSLAEQVSANRKNLPSLVGILVNFALFVGINLLYARALNADNAAHFGGLLAGVALGAAAQINGLRNTYLAEAGALVLFVAAFMAFPRYQVTYFNYFQHVLKVEDENSTLLKKSVTDEEFRAKMVDLRAEWDTARLMLDAHTWLPEDLHSDTFKMRRYLDLRAREADYRIAMVDLKTFRYLDSIDLVQEEMQPFFQLDYPLTMMMPIQQDKRDTVPPDKFEHVQVWYNDEWEELPSPPGKYYRMGQRDSIGQWQGPAWDFYANGKVQMKGRYLDNRQDGIFLYYSEHNTYTSAGRYEKGIAVGKWEIFYESGALQSEEYHLDRYFLGNAWDEEGNAMVVDGEGTYRLFHENGSVAEEGRIVEGRRNGLWEGWHDDGTLYFEEIFEDGRLIRGRSVTKEGEHFVYDASSLFPMPEGGNGKLLDYLNKHVAQMKPTLHGKVKVSFRVTTNRVLTDFLVIDSLSPELDAKAIKLVKDGPGWLPARDHGHSPRSGTARVTVEF